MSEENEVNEQEAIQQLYAFVASAMQAGSDKSAIVRKLEEHGVDRREAEQMTETVYDEIAAMAEKEKFTGSAMGPGLIGGLIGALVGGGVWAGIAITTDYELGIIAWAIGGLCGFGVVTLAGGRKGLPMQVIAVATSIFGIVAGKYFAFYYFLKAALQEEYGAESIADMSVFSVDVIQYFVEALPEIASGYDALWVVLAVITAWRIPQASGITVDAPLPKGPITPG